MYKFDGQLIHQSHDDDGLIEVIDRKGVRSLHFGSYPRQSSQLLSNPDKLQLEYVQAMTSWQLFKPELDDAALIIGLGGGSLAKYLLQNFPDCQFKAVEYRRGVVKVAMDFFGLPQHPHLKIVIADAAQYVARHKEKERGLYSLVLIDAFDHEGMAESINNPEFFESCQALLKADGMLVINLWGGVSNPQFIEVTSWLGRLFSWNTLFLPVKDRANIIGLVFNRPPAVTLDALRRRARTLEDTHAMPFTTFLKDLKKHNASVFKRLIKS